jgi:AraC-like DNA-binding protein/ligand-binding sensor protein
VTGTCLSVILFNMTKKQPSRIIGLEKLDVLDEIREVYYQNTGLIVSFHYAFADNYDFYPVYEKHKYCKLVQSTETGLAKCIESDESALDTAKKRNDYCIYTCHAGLTNVVIPLEYKDEEIGAIYTGQILTEKPKESQFDKVFNRIKCLGIRRDLLKDAYMKTKVVEKEKLLFGIKLLSLMSHYIISVEDEMYLQRELFQKDRDILRHENEKISLKNELQNLRISILEYDKNTEKSGSIINTQDLKNHHIVSKAQLFIKSNYHKKIMLSDVANAVYLSPNYFSTIFKELSGYTFSIYLMKVRIDVAKKLLLESDIPVKNIVNKVGFEDYNYFNRQFKKMEGVPPAKFRKIGKTAG